MNMQDLRELYHRLEGARILISGGAGFLGSWLCELLLSGGRVSITVVDDLSTGSLENIEHLLARYGSSIRLLTADVVKYEWDGVKYDYVVHMAARPCPDDYMQHPVETMLVNSIGTYRMLEVARRCDAVFVFASTSEVYGDAEVVPTPESYWGRVNPIGPRSCYDESKRFSEALCMAYHREYGLDVRIARIFNTYGPRLDWKSPTKYGRVVIRFIVQALRNEPITVHGDGLQTRSFCYVTDCVEALIRMMIFDEAKGEVINIGNPEETRIIDLARMIKELTGSRSPIIHLPPRPDDPRRRCPDISKAMQLLRWKPRVSLREGLIRTIEWVRQKMREEGLLR